SSIAARRRTGSFSPNTSLRLRSSKVDMLLDIVFSVSDRRPRATRPWLILCEILTLRLTQHLRIHCGRLTRHSEPTLALLQLLTGGMEAPGHEQKVTLQNQTHHYKIRSAPARSRARQNRGFE